MSVNLGGWIHSFAITETSTHKKGYTVYKVTSIVFPRSVPEALTCTTVWKRFREIKRLYRELNKRHKALHLRGQVPELKESGGFFKRFEPEVISERKDYILKLLDFAAQHPALYKSQSFLSFFETDDQTSEAPSPIRHNKSNIENICDNLDLPFQSTIQMIQPIDDSEKHPVIESFTPSVETKLKDEDNIDDEADCDTCSVEEETSSISSVLQINIHTDNDYIYEAAYEFSQAVQAEVNQNYKDAYNKYNTGIEKLLEGSKDDENEDRKAIAKAKVAKYMSRVQEICENHLLYEADDTKKSLHLSIDETESPKDVHLERPWNQLSKFKVIQVVDTVMLVQDVTTKSKYIMKTIEKPSTNTNSHSIFLPQNVPYMVGLLGFFQSDTTIFLLLQHAKGGKLMDYIRTYTPSGHITNSLSEIFSDYRVSEKIATPKCQSDDVVRNDTDDSGFAELLNEYEHSKQNHLCDMSNNPTEPLSENETIPSFSTLSNQMDANDLVNCSQKLLQSVSNTLEKFKDLKLRPINADSNNDELVVPKEVGSMPMLESPQKTEVEEFFENNQKSHSPLTTVGTNSNRHVVLPEVIVKQWARELIIAIESLHLKGVVLGDLHWRNILLGSNGQLLLSYFYQCAGFDAASQISISPYALDGFYVAPERPLTTKSDWWSFGVILFELLTGYSYKSCHPAGFGSYYEVQYAEVDVSEMAKDLLNGILQENPTSRFQIDQIKSHEFFADTVWDDLRNNGVN